MLTLEDLRLAQGDFTLEAALSVPADTVTAVTGPSGAGKSTLLAAIAGFLAPASGRVLWEGRDLTPLPPAGRPIAMLFQDNNLFPHMTARQNVGLALDPGLRLDRAGWQAVDAALERVDLAGLGERRPGQLSGGQQSRVALARLICQARPVILLDEPFAALGPGLKVQMLDLVSELRASLGATLLMVTHDPRDAERIASHLLYVGEGRAHAPEPVEAALSAPPEGLRRYLGL